MISVIRGEILDIDAQSLVVDVSGVGMCVNVLPTCVQKKHKGDDCFLYTSLIVREDSLTLYGFEDVQERRVFDILQSVSGIGPRIALAVLAVYTPAILKKEVKASNVAALQKVSGIGKKGAQRLLLELDNKLDFISSDIPDENNAIVSDPVSSDVIEALTGLGWSVEDAEDAYREVALKNGGADTSTLLRLSLQELGKRR
ncbi:MAG: Holliday junction branch migration protein RuvA [Actinomycetaceae bacterium]|nr:Holliday junction branch migration protein RuvA [Actinomycetaceae bacterium]